MNRAILTALCLFALAACDKPAEQKPAEPEPKQATPTEPTATPELVGGSIDDKDLTTPADFEEEAERSIDTKNYKKALAALEEEIGKE